MKTFSELPLSAHLKRNLGKHGFTELTPVQAQAIEPALAGKDLVATAQTGTGKTLAFVLPMIQLLETQPAAAAICKQPAPAGIRNQTAAADVCNQTAPAAIRKQTAAARICKQPAPAGILGVVLTPTRELAMQIDETFQKMAHGTGIRATVVVGGMSERTQLNSIRKGAQVLIATPGRLCDFLSRQLVDLSAVRMLVLDEADRMLDMGFLPTVRRILATAPEDRQTMLFSATIESSVRHLVDTQVRNAVRIEVDPITKPAEHVDLFVYEVEQDRKQGLLESMLRDGDGSFLVFSRTKRGAERLSKRLALGGVKTTAIHGDRSQNQRNQALKGFQDGYYRVLVATDVAARGIHVDGISHVVNYDLPQVPEDFIHRVGRTGRMGTRGVASTFATRMERSDIATIERSLKIRLTRRALTGEVLHEAPVIVMPTAARHVRSFGPGGRRSTGARRQMSCVV